MSKFNRSKMVRELHEEGNSKEAIIQKCIEAGDTRPDVLKYFVSFKIKQIESKKILVK